MGGGSARGRREKVQAARRQARTALGRDREEPGLDGPPKAAERYVEAKAPPELRPSEAVYALSVGEAATRLGVSRDELERMIDAGKIKALPTGYARMIPTSEVDRLTKSQGP